MYIKLGKINIFNRRWLIYIYVEVCIYTNFDRVTFGVSLVATVTDEW